MTYALVFNFVNAAVFPAWFLLILAPKWKGTRAWVHSMLYPLVLGAIYIGCFAMILLMGHGATDGGFTSIEAVRALYSTDAGVTIGWTHYLVFDLFVGAWIARDAVRRGVNHWATVPCLFFTFMAGPFGLVLYAILRKVTGKGGWSLAED